MSDTGGTADPPEDGRRPTDTDWGAHMAWSWRYETADGTVLDGAELPEELFPSRGDAESWLGETWRRLRDAGAERVTLFDGDTAAYTMSLNDEI